MLMTISSKHQGNIYFSNVHDQDHYLHDHYYYLQSIIPQCDQLYFPAVWG